MMAPPAASCLLLFALLRWTPGAPTNAPCTEEEERRRRRGAGGEEEEEEEEEARGW
jgi:hypothetical protein